MVLYIIQTDHEDMMGPVGPSLNTTDLETFTTSYVTIKHVQSKSLFVSCVSNLYKLK